LKPSDESAGSEAIRENAASLAKRIVRVVEEPEPIYRETLSPERMAELERRIFRLLREGDSQGEVARILDLSDRDAARVLNKMESLENGECISAQTAAGRKTGTGIPDPQVRGFEPGRPAVRIGKELFEQLQGEMEGCSTQIGRKANNCVFWKRRSWPLKNGSPPLRWR
jgi:DNA sulfur modification protein DndD